MFLDVVRRNLLKNVFFLKFYKGFTSIATAIVTEVFPPEKRATAVSTLLLPPAIVSIFLSPISGFAVQFFGGRACFWIIIIPCFFTIILLFFYLPETLDKTKRKRSINPISTAAVIFKYPLVGVIFCNGLLFAAMICVSSNYSIIISEYYDFGPAAIGLLYMPYSIGSLLGAIFGGRFADKFRFFWGLGGSVGAHIVFALIGAASIFLYSWSAPVFPILSALFAMVTSFGGASSRAAVFSLGIQLNPTSAASVTAALVCFQFLLSVVELTVTGILLGKVIPVIIYLMWAGLIILFMPFSVIVAFQYWNIKNVKTEVIAVDEIK